MNWSNSSPPAPSAPLADRLAWAVEFCFDGCVVVAAQVQHDPRVAVDVDKLYALLVEFMEIERLLDWAKETATSTKALPVELARVHIRAAHARSEFWQIVSAVNAPQWREFWGLTS